MLRGRVSVSYTHLYSSDHPAPGSSLKEIVLTAPDGASFRYDAEASALEAQGMKTAHIKASASVTLETPVVECTDHLKARTFELSEGGTMKGNVTHSGGSLSSNGVTVHSHVHGGVPVSYTHLIAPYFPVNGVLITPFKNLSVYYQRGGLRRTIKEEPEYNRVATYQSSNDDFVIEDYGNVAFIDGIQFAQAEAAGE